ncbi:MAG: hypothetical protein PHT30_05240 [Bacilli bacterium]|nr:hypothetical protein [Bacilli bacterium]
MSTYHIVNLASETTPFNSGNFSVTWSIVVGLLVVFAILLFSNLLRRVVPFIRKSLLPVAFIGGAIGLGLKIAFQYSELGITGDVVLTNGFTSMLQVITYHALAIGFISLGLKTIDKQRAKSKEMGRDSVKSGLIIIGTYLIQAIVGVSLTIVFSLIFASVVPYAGILLPMGFGQGPGQAMNIGGIFQNNGFVGGVDFGVTVSTLGFLSAAIGGVAYLNYAAKKGYVRRRNENDLAPESNELVEKHGEIPLSESIDKITIQVALVAFTYLITFGVIYGVEVLAKLSNVGFLVNTVVPLLYGFNFIFATIFAMIVKKVIASLHKKQIIKRQYVNNFMLERIAGLAFDVMIISSIMSIDIRNLADLGLIITLIVMCGAGALTTFFYVLFMTKKAYPGYRHQGFVTFYGNLTGTASDGIALLREIDPTFATPSADALVYGSTVAIALGFPVLLLTGYIYTDGNTLSSSSLWISYAIMIVYFIAINLGFFLLLKHHKKKDLAEIK